MTNSGRHASGTAHIVGAGLAGLAAAVDLANQGIPVVLHEASNLAGGRCRSYYDRTLDATIDNGNHLILSGNRATLDFLRKVGATDRLVGPPHAHFPFIDLANGTRWTLQLSDSRIPFWLLDPARRVAGTHLRDYLPLLRLMRVRPGDARSIAALCGAGPLYDRLIRPLFLAALNTDPAEAYAPLAAAVMRETLSAGGRACRPLIARGGLSHALIDPALAFIEQQGGTVHFGSRIRSLGLANQRAQRLERSSERSEARLDDAEPPEAPAGISLGSNDVVIVAVPPGNAAQLLPGLVVPDQFRAIVNAHFAIEPPPGCAPIIGVVNGLTEWIFAFEHRLSVTISGADRLLDIDRADLAQQIWQEVATITGAGDPQQLPRWQIVRERRATFAALPDQESRRPVAATRWSNVILAGDWTDTGLPATIEGAIRSGQRAAILAKQALSYE